jgi:putative nucleotidyltransferase with HDIG domain
MLDRLAGLNITSVYIQDERTSDLVFKEPVSEQTRRKAMALINDAFRSIQEDPQKWRQTFTNKQFGRQFRQVMSTVVDELKQNRSAMNLLGNACAADHYIFSHSFNVALYTIALAMKMGFNEKELLEIGLGAMLHDVGKMMLPLEILNKPGKLSDEEYEIVKKHTEYGFELLRREDDIPLLSAHCAFQHHERYDGSGYPRKLKKDEIHPFAQLVAVCDVFDALTSNRSYRKPILPHEAMEILFVGSDKQFAKEAVEGLRDTIALYPLGLSVTLNTGESGVVVDYNKGMPSRPIIRVLADENGQRLETPYEIDLSKRLHLMIVSCGSLI